MEDAFVNLNEVKIEVNGSQEPPPKTKAQLKAERREKQETQRAAKLKLKEEQAKNPSKNLPQKPQKQPPKLQGKEDSKDAKPDSQEKARNKAIEKADAKELRSTKIEMFSHLNQYDRNSHPTHTLSFSSSPVHPAFVKLGVQMNREFVVGSNGRCAALICAVKIFLQQYKCPESKEIRSHLNAALKPCFNYLKECRSMSISMENFVKYLRHSISKISPESTLDAAREEILEEHCDRYFEENIYLAAEAIAATAINRISDDDTILIYNRCPLILRILLSAKKEGKKFRVMVVDSRPDLRGVDACERLVAAGISCSYVYINSASYVMKEITKVLLPADGLLANGYVLGEVGSAMLALIARKNNKPVIVCCETYKFSERVQTDSIQFNELADPDDMLKCRTSDSYNSPLSDWQNLPNLNLVNLVYDATPPDLVSIVITEIAELPCTSAPVILRRDSERRC